MFGIIALFALFLFPIIASVLCKKYKHAIFSGVCAIPCIVIMVTYACGYVFTTEITSIVKIVSVILLAVCSVVSMPIIIAKVAVGLIAVLGVLIILFDISTSASVDVVIDGKEYEACFSSFNVGPTVVSYHEKENPLICKRYPAFYSSLLSMGSEEDMKQAIVDGEVGEFVNSSDEAVDDLLK
ncbi:MAG: hypothetical protein IKL36_00380 [Clostridia bacterium]|nr:hypothetical protein [Clostridia bacterium]